jgi:hypothetical protein
VRGKESDIVVAEGSVVKGAGEVAG